MSSRKPSARRWSRGLGFVVGVPFSARIASVAAVFLLCVLAFATGVTTTEHPGLANESWLAWLYYSGGLFVFGGLDLGLPTGGPAVPRIGLWIAYFLAPIVTTTAVAEALLKLVRPRWLQLRRLDRHLVIVGADKMGRLYMSGVRSLDPDRSILLVDRDLDRDVARLAGVETLRAEITDPTSLEHLQLQRARGLVVLTDNDLNNLDAAWTAQRAEPDLPVAVHVSDLALLRPVERATTSGRVPQGFNQHQIVASYLYQTRLAPHFDQTGYRDVVVLVGFGRFGQTILDILLDEASEELERIVLVRPDASTLLRQFEATTPPGATPILAVDLDGADPATWDTIDGELAGMEATPVFVVCDGDVSYNLRTALLLRSRSDATEIFVRCFSRSPFMTQLAEQRSLELLAFETVLGEALREHYHEHFRAEGSSRGS